MLLAQAQDVAQKVLDQLRPFCRRIEVAGSVRRRVNEVHDLEIVCIPKVNCYREFQLFVRSWPKLKGEPNGLHTRRKLPFHNVELDLFMCSPETWACNLVIRTGCAHFSQALACFARARGLRFQDAQLWSGSCSTGVREEEDVFRDLGIPWIEPADRTRPAARRLLAEVEP